MIREGIERERKTFPWPSQVPTVHRLEGEDNTNKLFHAHRRERERMANKDYTKPMSWPTDRHAESSGEKVGHTSSCQLNRRCTKKRRKRVKKFERKERETDNFFTLSCCFSSWFVFERTAFVTSWLTTVPNLWRDRKKEENWNGNEKKYFFKWKDFFTHKNFRLSSFFFTCTGSISSFISTAVWYNWPKRKERKGIRREVLWKNCTFPVKSVWF